MLDAGYAARVRRLVRLAGAEGLWVLVDMHQDLWSERFGGEGAPDWATLDDGQPFVSPPPSPTPTCSRPSGGPSRASGATGTGSAASTCAPTPGWQAAGAPRRGDRLRRDERAGVRARRPAPCGLPPQPAAATSYLVPFYRELVPALRSADPGTPTFYEDWLTTDFGYPFAVRLPYRNLGLSYHVYCGQPIRTDPCPVQETQALRNGAGTRPSTPPPRCVTEFGATDKLDVIRRVVAGADILGVGCCTGSTRPTATRRRRPPPKAPTPSRSSPRRAPSKAAKARELARAVPDAHRGATRAVAIQRARRTLYPALDRGPRRGHRRRAAALRLSARVRRRTPSACAWCAARPLTLRGAGRASITVSRR